MLLLSRFEYFIAKRCVNSIFHKLVFGEISKLLSHAMLGLRLFNSEIDQQNSFTVLEFTALYTYCLKWKAHKKLQGLALQQHRSCCTCLYWQCHKLAFSMLSGFSFQEVETDQFYKFFLPELKNDGYDGIFSPKSRARTMTENERKHVDGCAIFYRTSK